MGHPAYAEAYYAEPENLLPRWMKSVIARQSERAPALPFQRASKDNEGLLPSPRPGILLVMARIAQI